MVLHLFAFKLKADVIEDLAGKQDSATALTEDDITTAVENMLDASPPNNALKTALNKKVTHITRR